MSDILMYLYLCRLMYVQHGSVQSVNELIQPNHFEQNPLVSKRLPWLLVFSILVCCEPASHV